MSFGNHFRYFAVRIMCSTWSCCVALSHGQPCYSSFQLSACSFLEISALFNDSSELIGNMEVSCVSWELELPYDIFFCSPDDDFFMSIVFDPAALYFQYLIFFRDFVAKISFMGSKNRLWCHWGLEAHFLVNWCPCTMYGCCNYGHHIRYVLVAASFSIVPGLRGPTAA